jgi:hypothetical protein
MTGTLLKPSKGKPLLAQSLQRSTQQGPGTSPCIQELFFTHSALLSDRFSSNAGKKWPKAAPAWRPCRGRMFLAQRSCGVRGLRTTWPGTERQVRSTPSEPHTHGLRAVWPPPAESVLVSDVNPRKRRGAEL